LKDRDQAAVHFAAHCSGPFKAEGNGPPMKDGFPLQAALTGCHQSLWKKGGRVMSLPHKSFPEEFDIHVLFFTAVLWWCFM